MDEQIEIELQIWHGFYFHVIKRFVITHGPFLKRKPKYV